MPDEISPRDMRIQDFEDGPRVFSKKCSCFADMGPTYVPCELHKDDTESVEFQDRKKRFLDAAQTALQLRAEQKWLPRDAPPE